MRWSWQIAKVAGIPIRVHATFLIFLVFIYVALAQGQGPAVALETVGFFLALFGCVVLHELGHALTARRYGVRTRDITLLPIGGVARLERIPEKPGQEIAVALAGPAVNFLIAGILLTILLSGGGAQSVENLATLQGNFLERLLAYNVFLAIFNLIPAFPMDGGRVLRALLAIRLGHVRATEIAASIGQWAAFAFGFLGLLSGNFILIFIALFVYLAAASEAQMVSLRAMSRDVPVTAAMVTQFATLTGDEHIDAAVETLLQTSQTEFPVVDVDGNRRLIGVVGRGEIIRALRELGPSAPVSDVMVKDIPTIERSHRLEEAFRLLQEKSVPAVGVVDFAGRLIGLVTAETVGEMLMVRRALPKDAKLGPWSRPAGV